MTPDKQQNAILTQKKPIPRHIAIIMDGNGRWAKSLGKSRIEGHQAGAERVKEILDASFANGIEFVTLYAFSSENWNRPKLEVDALMALLKTTLLRFGSDIIKNEIGFHTIGDISALPNDCVTEIQKLKDATKDFRKHNIVLALNYGSINEIERAVGKIAKDVKLGKISEDSINWNTISSYLDTANIPNPDLLIRTSGEKRLSNYLMLQSAYAEIYFTNVNWPDFDKIELKKALDDFSTRERRYGKTGEQINNL